MLCSIFVPCSEINYNWHIKRVYFSPWRGFRKLGKRTNTDWSADLFVYLGVGKQNLRCYDIEKQWSVLHVSDPSVTKNCVDRTLDPSDLRHQHTNRVHSEQDSSRFRSRSRKVQRNIISQFSYFTRVKIRDRQAVALDTALHHRRLLKFLQ